MQEFPLVTCFLLSYNRFEYIFQAIDSILVQTYPRIELAIFDDASSEFPAQEIEEYIAAHKKDNIENVIVYQHEQNQGTVKNFNSVIDNTHGKYIFGAGIDDLLYDKYVFEKLVDFFEKTGASIVTCFKEVISQDGKTLGFSPSKHNAEKLKKATPDELFKWIAMGAAVAGAGTYYSREIFAKIGKFDERYRLQEDGPFYLKATRNGYKIYLADIIAVKYRQGNGVSSGSELHPALKKDINLMLQQEVLPYLDRFNYWQKRRIYYQIERFKLSKVLSNRQKIFFCLKYPDVILYRRLRSK